MVFQIGDKVITPRHRIAKIVSGSTITGFWLQYEDDGDMVTIMPSHLKIYEISGSKSRDIGPSKGKRRAGHKPHRKTTVWRAQEPEAA